MVPSPCSCSGSGAVLSHSAAPLHWFVDYGGGRGVAVGSEFMCKHREGKEGLLLLPSSVVVSNVGCPLTLLTVYNMVLPNIRGRFPVSYVRQLHTVSVTLLIYFALSTTRSIFLSFTRKEKRKLRKTIKMDESGWG